LETYSEVIGLPVICVDNGKKVGSVTDVFFNPENRKVLAFLVDSASSGRSKYAILLKNVRSLGNDALIIDSKKVLMKVKPLKRSILTGNGKLTDMRVYSRKGDYFGLVKDILFNYETGDIEAVKVSNGLISDIIEGRDLIPLFGKVEFSEEIILINREAVEEISNTGGGLKNKFRNG